MRLLFLLFPILLFSQSQTAKGVVLDKETNAPVPYVNISILASQSGTSSDEDGTYTLEIKDDDLVKEIHMSSLGYRDTTIVASSFHNLKEVFLQPLVEQLNEVVVTEKFEQRFIEVNSIKKRELIGGFGGFKNHPYIFALYIPYKSIYKDTDYIDNVKVHLNKVNVFGQSKSMPSRFRFRMFTVGKDSLPGEDLISKNLIIETSKKQRIVEIDLSEYNFSMPKEGVYVAIEWLHIPFNAYEFSYTKGKVIKKKIIETRYAPRLSWIKRKSIEDKLAVFALGRWIQMDIPLIKKDEYMIPAISLTLSN